MKLREKAQTALWLLTKRPGIGKRLALHAAFRRQNKAWGELFDWRDRINDALSCPDNAFIPRVASAGKIVDGQLIMHNGLRVHELSYDGEGPRDLMRENRGVHEPQEERLFMEVLKRLPRGSIMLELGSYWAFYSMWFYREIPDAKCYCVEPETRNISMGKNNFALNFGPEATGVVFEQAFAGSSDAPPNKISGIPTVSVDGFLQRHGIGRLSMLHADTQGNELAILLGAEKALARKSIDFVFLSTHTNELHRKCLMRLRGYGYEILADIDLLETYSFDGLIAARSPRAPETETCELSLKGYPAQIAERRNN